MLRSQIVEALRPSYDSFVGLVPRPPPPRSHPQTCDRLYLVLRAENPRPEDRCREIRVRVSAGGPSRSTLPATPHPSAPRETRTRGRAPPRRPQSCHLTRGPTPRCQSAVGLCPPPPYRCRRPRSLNRPRPRGGGPHPRVRRRRRLLLLALHHAQAQFHSDRHSAGSAAP